MNTNFELDRFIPDLTGKMLIKQARLPESEEHLNGSHPLDFKIRKS
jgi:hypothetical protein